MTIQKVRWKLFRVRWVVEQVHYEVPAAHLLDMEWFLGCLGRAFDGAETTLASVLRKARFWEQHGGTTLNGRQRLLLNKMLDGFEGKLNSSKWAKLAKRSQDTAHRDIQYLIEHDTLVKDPAGGRSTSD